MKHSGLTLIEILIAALIISILISIILFSSTEAQTTAQADHIINNFENIRMAYTTLYAEADIDINDSSINNVREKFTVKSILKYINDTSDIDKYSLTIDDSGSWFISLKLDNNADTSRLKRKLSGHAISSGLLGSNSSNLSSIATYTNQDYVIVRLR